MPKSFLVDKLSWKRPWRSLVSRSEAAASCGQMQYRDRQSLGPLQTEIAEDNKEPELGASPGPRLGRKAAERKAGREGSLRGSS